MTQFMLSILEISLSMTAVVAVLLILSQIAGRRFTAKSRYIIWLIVIVRFAVPFSGGLIPSVIELDIPYEAEEKYTVNSAEYVNAEYAETTFTDPQAVSEYPDYGYSGAAALNETAAHQIAEAEYPAVNSVEAPPTDYYIDKTASDPEITETDNSHDYFGFGAYAETVLRVLACVYVSGAAVFFLWKLMSYLAYTEMTSKSNIHVSSETYEIYLRICDEMGISRIPELYVNPLVGSPFLYGFFKPCIVLSDGLDGNDAVTAVLSHELTHYRRCDLWLKLIGLIAESLHWYNPFVHMAVRRFEFEMELSCDEQVLSGLDENTRVNYGIAVIDIVKRCEKSKGSLTTHFNTGSGMLKKRIVNILDSRAKYKGGMIIVCVLAVCLLAGSIIACNIGTSPAVNDGTEAAETTTLPPESDTVMNAVSDETEQPSESPTVMKDYEDGALTDSVHRIVSFMNTATTFEPEDCVFFIKYMASKRYPDAVMKYPYDGYGEVKYIESKGDYQYVGPEYITIDAMNKTLYEILSVKYDYNELPAEERDCDEDGNIIDGFFLVEAFSNEIKFYDIDSIQTDGASYYVQVTFYTDDFMTKIMARNQYIFVKEETGYRLVRAEQIGLDTSNTYTVYGFDSEDNYRPLGNVQKSISVGDDGSVTAHMANGYFGNTLTGVKAENGLKSVGAFLSDTHSVISVSHGNRADIYISSDNGTSWKQGMSIAHIDGDVGTILISFVDDTHGYLMTNCGVRTYKNEEVHRLYTTSDGGLTWAELDTNINDIYNEDIFGFGFADENTGFISFKFSASERKTPAIYMTSDGGVTWSECEAAVNAADDGHFSYTKIPSSPVFDGKGNGIITFFNVPDYQYDRVETTVRYLLTADNGKTWSASLVPYDYPVTITSLDDWGKISPTNQFSENCYNFFWNLLSGESEFPEYNSVIITDWSITNESFSPTNGTLLFDFTVEKSELDTIPAGTYHKSVYDGVDCFMDDIEKENKLIENKFDGIEEVRMYKEWIMSAFNWDCPTYGEYDSYSGIVSYLCNYYSEEFGGYLPVDTFIKLAKEKFGVENADLSELELRIVEINGERYVAAGALGGAMILDILSCDKTDDITTLTVQYYADCNKLLKSYKVAYKIKEIGIWLGYEILEDSAYEPYYLHRYFS